MLSRNNVAHKQKQIGNTTNTKIKAYGGNYVLQGGVWGPNSFDCWYFLVFTSPQLKYKKKITKNEKKSTLCFLVYLEILFAHCCCNFHNSMKTRNQRDLALDATQKLIQQ